MGVNFSFPIFVLILEERKSGRLGQRQGDHMKKFAQNVAQPIFSQIL
jgi:hypothetical protein